MILKHSLLTKITEAVDTTAYRTIIASGEDVVLNVEEIVEVAVLAGVTVI